MSEIRPRELEELTDAMVRMGTEMVQEYGPLGIRQLEHVVKQVMNVQPVSAILSAPVYQEYRPAKNGMRGAS